MFVIEGEQLMGPHLVRESNNSLRVLGREKFIVFSDVATGELLMLQWITHTSVHTRPWLKSFGHKETDAQTKIYEGGSGTWSNIC